MSALWDLIAQKDNKINQAIAIESKNIADESKKTAEDSKTIALESKGLAESSASLAADSKEIAEDSRQIAEETKRDSTSMKAIAMLTMVFLPATFAAVRESLYLHTNIMTPSKSTIEHFRNAHVQLATWSGRERFHLSRLPHLLGPSYALNYSSVVVMGSMANLVRAQATTKESGFATSAQSNKGKRCKKTSRKSIITINTTLGGARENVVTFHNFNVYLALAVPWTIVVLSLASAWQLWSEHAQKKRYRKKNGWNLGLRSP